MGLQKRHFMKDSSSQSPIAFLASAILIGLLALLAAQSSMIIINHQSHPQIVKRVR